MFITAPPESAACSSCFRARGRRATRRSRRPCCRASPSSTVRNGSCERATRCSSSADGVVPLVEGGEGRSPVGTGFLALAVVERIPVNPPDWAQRNRSHHGPWRRCENLPRHLPGCTTALDPYASPRQAHELLRKGHAFASELRIDAERLGQELDLVVPVDVAQELFISGKRVKARLDALV